MLNAIYQSIHLSTNLNMGIKELYQRIWHAELWYSICLVARLLQFYQYDQTTYKCFFSLKDKRHPQPILLWEYIFLRTQLMVNREAVSYIVSSSLLLTKETASLIVDQMRFNAAFFTKLDYCLARKLAFHNISYTLVDLDWNEIN